MSKNNINNVEDIISYFCQSKKEILKYYVIIYKLELKPKNINYKFDNNKYTVLLAINKSTMYMIIYNFMEAVVRKILSCLCNKEEGKIILPCIDHRAIEDQFEKNKKKFELSDNDINDMHVYKNILFEIKNMRINLAHGHDTYHAAGRRKSISDIRKDMKSVFLYYEIFIEKQLNIKL